MNRVVGVFKRPFDVDQDRVELTHAVGLGRVAVADAFDDSAPAPGVDHCAKGVQITARDSGLTSGHLD